ncbi:MAG: preQ(1) synthase [Planctomycetia bacterium]|nr:preQ(1) synthase [Planctomycetia bacterium]
MSAIPSTPSPDILEVFDNPYPGRDYIIKHVAPEFTSLCPKTGQPDYGEITIEYIAGKTCVELKSLKFYLQSYRNYGAFYERVTNQILDDLTSTLKPQYMKIEAKFTPRGGMHSEIVVEYVDPELQCEHDGCGCHCDGHCHDEEK